MTNSRNKQKQALDRTDFLILKTLQIQGRISYVDLAETIHLSPSPCLERVRRLEKQGYIKGYAAQLDQHLLGFGEIAFIQISLHSLQPKQVADFKRDIDTIPTVVECYTMTGDYDFLLKIQFRDLAHLRRILNELQNLPNVIRCNTAITVEQLRSRVTTQLPLDDASPVD